MHGVIVNFRGSRRVKRHNQMIMEVPGVDSKEKATKLVGKKVTWTTPGQKKMVGAVTAIHGNSGALRIRFDTGMPGQSIGEKVSVE